MGSMLPLGLSMLWEPVEPLDALRQRFGFDDFDAAAKWAAIVLDETWGIAVAECSRIVISDHNAIVWVDTDHGHLIVKWSRARERFAGLDFSTRLLRAVSGHGIPVARPIATAHGLVRVVLDGPSCALSAAVLPEVTGDWLDVNEPAAVEAAGVCLARVHRALAACGRDVPPTSPRTCGTARADRSLAGTCRSRTRAAVVASPRSPARRLTSPRRRAATRAQRLPGREHPDTRLGGDGGAGLRRRRVRVPGRRPCQGLRLPRDEVHRLESHTEGGATGSASRLRVRADAHRSRSDDGSTSCCCGTGSRRYPARTTRPGGHQPSDRRRRTRRVEPDRGSSRPSVGITIAAARRWAPTSTALVAVSSGAVIAGTSDRPTATAVTATNRRRWRSSRAITTPAAAPTRVHQAKAGSGMTSASISRLTPAALAIAATTVVQMAASAPASAPVRTRRRVLGRSDCTTRSWSAGRVVVFIAAPPR